jgi:hypothetical protein
MRGYMLSIKNEIIVEHKLMNILNKKIDNNCI